MVGGAHGQNAIFFPPLKQGCFFFTDSMAKGGIGSALAVASGIYKWLTRPLLRVPFFFRFARVGLGGGGRRLGRGQSRRKCPTFPQLNQVCWDRCPWGGAGALSFPSLMSISESLLTWAGNSIMC